jgi:Zn ribbon nucleic-acid-binding protein
MKCSKCGHWNRIEVEKVFFNPDSPEPKVQVFLPSYLPLKTETCSKCGHVIAQQKELIRIVKNAKTKS